MSLLRRLWSFWKTFGVVLGHVQSTILLAIIYHLGVGPISLASKAMRVDLLQLRRRQGDSHAEPLATITTTMERAEKQF